MTNLSDLFYALWESPEAIAWGATSYVRSLAFQLLPLQRSRLHDYNIFNPINQLRPDNPLKPINSVDSKNPFNPINEFKPNNPLSEDNVPGVILGLGTENYVRGGQIA